MVQVSVIIPLFNRVHCITQTIESVMAQQYDAFELIVVDDGSTDGGDKLVRDMAATSDTLHFLSRPVGSKGAPACRNFGASKAVGQFLIFLDSDDLLSSGCLSSRVELMSQEPTLDFAVFPTRLFTEQEGDLDLMLNRPTDEDAVDRFLKKDQMWLTTGPIWRKSSFMQLGGFDESLHSYQDFDLHMRAMITGLAYRFIETEPDNHYRVDVQDSIRSSNRDPKHLHTRQQMIIRCFELMKENQCVTELRRILIARWLLEIASEWRWHWLSNQANNPNSRASHDTWQKVREKSIVSIYGYWCGLWYIRMIHFKPLYSAAKLQAFIELVYRRVFLRKFFVRYEILNSKVPFHSAN